MSLISKLWALLLLCIDHLSTDLFNLIIVTVDSFDYKFGYLFFLWILILYSIFLFILFIYYAAILNGNEVSLNNKQLILYITTMLFFIGLTLICYYYDINIYTALKQDYQITKYHCVVQYAMISWFIILVMIAIYLYMYNTIDMYLWFAIFVYILLTFFIIYLLLCELYIINPLITAEIDRQNYLAKKIAEANATQARLEQAELDHDMYVVVTVIFYVCFFCISVYLTS